jgi:hypothetical protein
MYDKIDSLLPVFFALTSNVEAAKRLVLMKYVFEDQLNALQQNKYVITAEQLNKLREHFSGYFSWVRNAVSLQGQQQQQQQQQQHMPVTTQQLEQVQKLQQHSRTDFNQPQQQVQQQPSLQSQQLQNQQLQNQQLQNQQLQNQQLQNQQLQNQQLQNQQQIQAAKLAQAQLLAQQQLQQRAQPQQPSQNTTRVSPVQQPVANTPTMIPSGQIRLKRSSMDLKLPPSKKQKNTAPNTPQHTAVDLTQTTPQQAHAAPEPVTNEAPNNSGMTMNQRQAQSQMIHQAALASGLPLQIVNLLPPRALQCCWILQQAAQNRMNLTPQQQQYIRQTLNERVEAAKQQLAKQAAEKQQAQAQPQLQSQAQPQPQPQAQAQAQAQAQTQTQTQTQAQLQSQTQSQTQSQGQSQPQNVVQVNSSSSSPTITATDTQQQLVKSEVATLEDHKNNNESSQQATQMMHLLQQQQKQQVLMQQAKRQTPQKRSLVSTQQPVPQILPTQPISTPIQPTPQLTPPQQVKQQVQTPPQQKITVPSPRPTPGIALKMAVMGDQSPMLYVNDIQKEVDLLFSRPDQQPQPQKSFLLQPDGPRNTLLFEPYPMDDLVMEERRGLIEDEIADTWYEVGMETGVPEMHDIFAGFSFDDYTHQAFISTQ